MHDQDQEYDVAEPELAEGEPQGEHSLPQRTRTDGIWRHLPGRAEPADDVATGDETAAHEAAARDETAPADERAPADPPAGIGRLVVAADDPADKDEGGTPGPDCESVNPIAADEVAHEPLPSSAGSFDLPAAAAMEAAAPLPVAGSTGQEPAGPAFASHQWREIQASFVDD